MDTNLNEPNPVQERPDVSERVLEYLINSGAWIGALSCAMGIAVVFWLLNRLPDDLELPWSVKFFVGLTACPYLIIAFFSCFVSTAPAKTLLFFGVVSLVITTCWQFSIRDAQAAIIIFYQFPGALITGVLAVLINLLTRCLCDRVDSSTLHSRKAGGC